MYGTLDTAAVRRTLTVADLNVPDDILADVIAPDQGDLTMEVAQSVLRWKFTDGARARMNDLADCNNKGTISAQERQELEKYLRVGSLINILQAKARLSLNAAGQTGS